MPTPAATISAVVPCSVVIDGVGAELEQHRISGTSSDFAASRNGVAPMRFEQVAVAVARFLLLRGR